MSGFNQCTFVGNLGADPEVRYTQSGDAVANFRVGVNEKYGDKEHTEWVRCVAFKRLAEVCGEYLRKGSKVLVSGRLQTRKWQNREGQDQYTTEVVVGRMVMLGDTAASRSYGGFRDRDEPSKSDVADDGDIPF